MKRKFKLFATLASLCLSVALMAFGVYAATNVTYNVTSTVSFAAQVAGQFGYSISGGGIAETSTNQTRESLDDANYRVNGSEVFDNNGQGTTKTLSTLALPDMVFDISTGDKEVTYYISFVSASDSSCWVTVTLTSLFDVTSAPGQGEPDQLEVAVGYAVAATYATAKTNSTVAPQTGNFATVSQVPTIADVEIPTGQAFVLAVKVSLLDATKQLNPSTNGKLDATLVVSSIDPD